MIKKAYKYGNIKYCFGLTGRKWLFSTPKFSLIAVCGGKEKAEKVAHAVAGALKRTKNVGMDNLGRFQVKQITGV